MRCTIRFRGFAVACLLFGALAFRATAAQAPEKPPRELVRMAIQNQLQNDKHSSLFTWKERKYRGPETQIEQIVDTPNGFVSRVVLIDDKPLDAEQRAREDERIRKALEPSQMRRKHKERQADDERTKGMLGAIPDAFDFTYVDSTQAPNGHKISHLKFVARPGFSPPNSEAAVFCGMQGDMLVDETAGHLARIDGTLFKDVTFGWGILGRLYKGGRFLVEQSEVSPSHWDTTRMILRFEGKALFFKSIHIDDNEASWDFQPVHPMSVQQAMNFLVKSEQSPQNARLDH